MPSTKEDFLSLIRVGIGHTGSVPTVVDWKVLGALANNHGLLAIMIDGIERLPEQKRPPKSLLLEWIGNTLHSYEQRYVQYEKAIGKLADLYIQHGYKMMLLKGYACSLNWPKPEHRPCGDIDIWMFGKQKEADETLRHVLGSDFKIDNSHHHHTVFEWKGFTIENHYDFVNVHADKSSKDLEIIFKDLAMDDSYFTAIYNEKVYLPSPNLHALFLIRHMVSHFAAAEISLRQVLDWAFFVEKHKMEIDWKWLLGVLEEHHMKDFFNLVNAICVDDLEFSLNMFPTVQFLPSLKERVLNDIIEPEFGTAEPHGLFKRLVYKYRRWQGNAWKQKLCYNESRRSMFWMGIWAKLLKPASF